MWRILFLILTISSCLADGILLPPPVISVAAKRGAVTLACSDLTNAATSCSTDTTSATNITSGTLPNARLVSVPNSALANSSVTLGATSVSLGATATTLDNLILNFNTVGPGTSSNTYITGNGSGRLLLNVPTGQEMDFTVNGSTIAGVSASSGLFVLSGGISTTTLTGSALPDTGVGDTFICITGAGVFRQGATCAASTERIKDHIKPFKNGLALVKKMEPVSFIYNKNAGKAKVGKSAIGLIAEKSAKLDPRLAIFEKDGKTPLSVDDRAYIAVLIKAVQELSAEVDHLKSKH